MSEGLSSLAARRITEEEYPNIEYAEGHHRRRCIEGSCGPTKMAVV